MRLLAHVRERQARPAEAVPGGHRRAGLDPPAHRGQAGPAPRGRAARRRARAGGPAAPATAPAAGATEAVAEATIVQVAERAVEGAPARSTRNGGAAAPPPPTARDLGDLSDDELLERIERLDRALGKARVVLIRRYAAAEAELARLGVKPKPAAKRPPAKRPKGPSGRPDRPKAPGRQADAPADRAPQRDPARDEQITIQAGHASWRVRQSKVALARYLKRHRRATTGGLRRKLLTEVRTPKAARRATPAWERAVREAQAIAKLPVTGTLDEPLAKVLAPLWPSDADDAPDRARHPGLAAAAGPAHAQLRAARVRLQRRHAVRRRPDARAGADEARGEKRAKQLAERLERVRAREGNRPLRPNSVFRTKAYNARVGGVVGSAHTRGYAADLPAPPAITLARHREHVRAVFEGGVGYYPTKHFVHGDFDPNERGDSWTG